MASDDTEHEFDDRLADSTLWGWFKPTFALAVKHWQLCVVAGLVGYGLEWLFVRMPWRSIGRGWWVEALAAYAEMLIYGLAMAAGYRFLAAREKVGSVNEWPTIVVRVVQIQTIWIVAGCVAAGAVVLLLLAVGHEVRLDSIYDLYVYASLERFIALVMLLLMPVWFSLAVGTALSEVYAVRSSESAWGAVKASLRLAFEQKWRVFWPSYLVVVLVVVVYVVLTAIAIFTPILILKLMRLELFQIVTFALIVPLMFVLERTYASHLTLNFGAEAEAPLPPPSAAPPPRVRTPGSPPSAAAPRVRTPGPPAPPAPLPNAPNEIADRLAEDMRTNRMQRFVETVERGLKADPRFFLTHPDETLALARRLANAKRADLALRVVQPYLKEHRAHRQHLTVALYVANLLLRDLGRKADAARFLGQVKTLYPNEPMVDQLIKITDKAIAEGAGPRA